MRFFERLLGKLWNLSIAICKAVKGFVRKIGSIFFDRAHPLLPLQNPAAAAASTITEPLLRHTPALISSPTTFDDDDDRHSSSTTFDDDRYSVCEDRILWCQAEIHLYQIMTDYHVAALDMATVFVDEDDDETPYLKKKKEEEEEEEKKKKKGDKEKEKKEVEETSTKAKRKKKKKLKEKVKEEETMEKEKKMSRRQKKEEKEKEKEREKEKEKEKEEKEKETKEKRMQEKEEEKEKEKEKLKEKEREEETMEKEKKMSRRQKKEEKRKEKEKEEEDKKTNTKKENKSVIVVVEQRWIKHYSSHHRILLVGEGNFSFSACLAKAFRCASNIIATSLDSEAFLKENYKKASSNIEELKSRGSKVMHGIDATTMADHHLLGLLQFDRIVFNFPYAGFFPYLSTESQLRHHRRLVSMFMKNAKEMIGEDGEIHISHKTNGDFHAQFDLESIASSHGLRLIEAVEFKRSDYPGYNTKYGFGGDNNFNCVPSNTFKFGLKRRRSEVK